APSVSHLHPQPGFPAARLWLLLATGPGSHARQCRDDCSAPGATQPSLSRPHQAALRLCPGAGSLLLNPPRCPSLLALGEDGLMSSWGNKAFSPLFFILPVSMPKPTGLWPIRSSPTFPSGTFEKSPNHSRNLCPQHRPTWLLLSFWGLLPCSGRPVPSSMASGMQMPPLCQWHASSECWPPLSVVTLPATC
ncbi:unnamed protein product, partial [Gulo gulo]